MVARTSLLLFVLAGFHVDASYVAFDMALAVVAAALFVVGVACWLATSGRLRPRDSPPVVREGKPIVGNLLGFALGKRGPLDFIERNYHRYGGARPRE